MQLITEVLGTFKIPLETISTSTQDSTASSINVFDEVPVVHQLKCACHLLHLVVKKIYAESPAINTVYEAIHSITKSISRSPKRITTVRRYVEAKGEVFKMPILGIKTRWNSVRDEIIRFLHNWPHYEAIRPRDLYTTRDEQDVWTAWKDTVEEGKHYFEHVLPVMKKIAEYISVLQGKHYATGSLVRPAMRDIKRCIYPLQNHVNEIKDDMAQMTDYFAYADFVDAFIASMELYCGREYVDHFPFRVASLLDPRVFKHEGNPSYVVEGLKDSDFLYPEETEIIGDNMVQVGQGESALSALSRQANAGDEPASKVDRELKDYYRIVLSLDVRAQSSDPLYFWAKMRATNKLPILTRCAERSLVTKASSAAAESVFSTGGTISTDRRSSLSGGNLNMLIVTKNWIEKEIPDEANFARKALIRQRKVDLLISRFKFNGNDEDPVEEDNEEEEEDEYAEFDEEAAEVVVVGEEEEVEEEEEEEEVPVGPDIQAVIEERLAEEEVARLGVIQLANNVIEDREKLANIQNINERREARDAGFAVNDVNRAARIRAREIQREREYIV